MNKDDTFEEFSIVLKDLSKLPRQSIVMQVLLTMKRVELQKDGGVQIYRYDGEQYLEYGSLLSSIASEPNSGNFSNALRQLAANGFVKRLVVTDGGRELLDDDFRSKSSKVYWCLSQRARLVLSMR